MINASLGSDIGNGTIKLVLVSEKKEIVDYVYLKNLGIVNTIQKGLTILSQRNKQVNVISSGVTGAGRQFANKIIGADAIKTEILAFSIGCLHFVPNVQTLIDLGQEDSKLLIIKNNVLNQFEMNSICLKEDTDITLNPFISKSIKDIKIGDNILTHKGRFRRVNKIYKNKYNGKIINISLSNLRKLEITPEHPILSLKRKDIKCYMSKTMNQIRICRPDRNLEWCKERRCKRGEKVSFEPQFIKANELEKGDLIAIPIPSKITNLSYVDYNKVKRKRIKFANPEKKIDKFYLNSDMLRFLGYYLAEGCILYNRSRKNKKIKYHCGISLTFNNKEDKYINDIFEIASKNFSNITIKCIKKPEKHVAIIGLYSKVLAEYIDYFCGSHSNLKVMKDELMFLNPELQLEILKGLFRGDGCFVNKLKNGRVERRFILTTISKQLAYQVQWILLRNKIKCSFYKENKKTKGGHIAYNIEINALEINKLKDDLFYINENEIKKIHSYSFIYSDWLFSPIKKISEYGYKGYVYNLQVEDDNSYVANSLAVHNCSAGCGSYLENVAVRFGIKIEDFEGIALKSKNPITISGKCAVFGTSSCVSELNAGTKIEDIFMGVSKSLVRNVISTLSKHKKLNSPIVFGGGVSLNKSVVKAFEEELNHKIIVPKFSTILSAIGIAIIALEQKIEKTNFRGFKIKDLDINSSSFRCKDCSNNCKVVKIVEGKVITSYLGSKCEKYKAGNPTD